MKRVINFLKDDKYYIFESEEKKIKISIEDKILHGEDLYLQFFEDYDLSYYYELVDRTTSVDKENDKMCSHIFEEVKNLFENIENLIKKDNNFTKEMKNNDVR